MSSPPSTLLEDARMVVDGGPLGTGSKQETGRGEASPEDNSADPQPSSSLDGQARLACSLTPRPAWG